MADAARTARRLVVLTAVDIEYEAVRRHLTGVVPERHPSGTRFERGGLPGTGWEVVIALTGPGNLDAGVLAERAIARYSPAAALFVGIAGALRDWISLGDVVVATRVFAYHGGRDDRSGFHARPRGWDASHGLEQLARHVAREGEWSAGELLGARRPPPAVHFAPIAAGEVLLNSPSSPLARQLGRQYNDAVAIEMESAGACTAAHLNGSLPMLTVRGISDSVHSVKENAERDGWPVVAAHRAASFAAHILRHLEPDEVGDTPPAGPVAANAGPTNVQINSATGGVVFGVQGGTQIVHGWPPR